MFLRRISSLTILLSTVFVLFSCVPAQQQTMAQKKQSVPIDYVNIARQILVVEKVQGSISNATVTLLEKDDTGALQVILPKMSALVGRNGIARFDKKVEGDGKTPSGSFPLSLVFGYNKIVKTKMPYKMATANDFWIDDINHPLYNKWVNDTKGAKSFEKMRRDDHRYKYGIVVDYNVNPIVPGKGSAIFIHVRFDEHTPTSGCIALAEKDILNIIKKLSPDKNPIIMIP